MHWEKSDLGAAGFQASGESGERRRTRNDRFKLHKQHAFSTPLGLKSVSTPTVGNTKHRSESRVYVSVRVYAVPRECNFLF